MNGKLVACFEHEKSPPGTIGRYDIEVGVMCLKDRDLELGDSHSSVEKWKT